ADTALHELLCERLDALSLGIPILSEESEGAEIVDRLTWPACWVVDPLDGTKEFIEKTDQFTINIALVLDGVSELGLISIPCRKEHWVGIVHNGAAVFAEGEGLTGAVVKTQSRNCKRPLVMLASHRHSPKRVQALVDRLSLHFGDVVRRNAGSAVKFCDVAVGSADVYPRTSACSEWDVAAGDALVRAAGGRVTKFDGEPIKYNQRPSLLAESFIAGGDARVDYAAIFSEQG
ncbi:MAG: 3'(2'),5'-bisphosphate nucleotidase, partial [Luminiphilus sp.]|nr:3'(2'),5'-bisphosphate nucleotidase [Luminiphilus sp.]